MRRLQPTFVYSDCFCPDDSEGSDGSSTSPKYWPAGYSEPEPQSYPGQANVPEPAQGRLQVRAHLLQQFHCALPHNVEDKWTRSCSKPAIQSQSQPASICSSASVAGRCCRCTQTAVASLAASPCQSCGTRRVNKEAACCSRSSARIRSSSSDFLT